MNETEQKEQFLAFIRKSDLDVGKRWRERERAAPIELTREVYRAALKEMDSAELTMLIEDHGLGWDHKEGALLLYRRSEDDSKDEWLEDAVNALAVHFKDSSTGQLPQIYWHWLG